jgi:hypothetical protein
MPLLGQPFGEDVSDVVLSADVAEGDRLSADLLPDEVVLEREREHHTDGGKRSS